MRTVEEHRAALVGLVSALPPVIVGLSESLGRVLAADVVAAVDLPGFDNSAMDGYAVRSADVAGASAASPVVLDVDGDIAAGDTRRHEPASRRDDAHHDGRADAHGCRRGRTGRGERRRRAAGDPDAGGRVGAAPAPSW